MTVYGRSLAETSRPRRGMWRKVLHEDDMGRLGRSPDAGRRSRSIHLNAIAQELPQLRACGKADMNRPRPPDPISA